MHNMAYAEIMYMPYFLNITLKNTHNISKIIFIYK